VTDVAITVAGQAGQGIDTASELLARSLMRGGYYVFAYPDVMSRIRGGHNFTSVRVSERAVYGGPAKTSLLLALDERSVTEHKADMAEGGIIVADTAVVGGGGTGVLGVPMAALAQQHTGSRTMANMVGMGALFALIGYPIGALLELVRERFGPKGETVVRQNEACVKASYQQLTAGAAPGCPCRIPPRDKPQRRLLLSGNQAIALGALASGVRFYAGYPMSPSTPVMEYLAANQREAGLVMEQVEDELAAINAVLGASYAGARAMTATSGGGFSLMVEGLGLAGMAEIPCVIVLAQRPGPATGFPTRTEQGELLFAISASQDEFPRFVFAPGDAEQAFQTTIRAFELAYRFHVPAIVLSDQFLSDSLWTVPGLEPEHTVESADFADAQWRSRPAYSYRSYAVTRDGVSPRLRPGFPGQLVRALGTEHDEQGFQTEDGAVRRRMHEKRMRKRAAMAETLGQPHTYPGHGEDSVVLCFGSTRGVVQEAIDLLRAERIRVGMLHLSELCPFPHASVMARLARARKTITVENNSTGQLGRLLARETRIKPDTEILKYDGRPFTGQELAGRLADELRRP